MKASTPEICFTPGFDVLFELHEVVPQRPIIIKCRYRKMDKIATFATLSYIQDIAQTKRCNKPLGHIVKYAHHVVSAYILIGSLVLGYHGIHLLAILMIVSLWQINPTCVLYNII